MGGFSEYSSAFLWFPFRISPRLVSIYSWGTIYDVDLGSSSGLGVGKDLILKFDLGLFDYNLQFWSSLFWRRTGILGRAIYVFFLFLSGLFLISSLTSDVCICLFDLNTRSVRWYIATAWMCLHHSSHSSSHCLSLFLLSPFSLFPPILVHQDYLLLFSSTPSLNNERHPHKLRSPRKIYSS